MAKAPEILPAASTLRFPPLLLAGPTAVGKSEIAIVLTERLGGEIISVDSMQVYRGLEIGTAKPPPSERARIPHHLIDVVDLTETFDAAKFAVLAHKAVADIQSRGRVPILCGGTGLYFKAFLEGLGEAPPADPQLRAELEATPLADLIHQLKTADPITCEKIDRKNRRRVVRAIEVIRLTGKPFSAQRAPWSPAETRSTASQTSHVFFGLSRTSDDLRQRMDARVEQMFRRGLVDETRRLLDRGLDQNETAQQAIGYRQVIEHLRGARSLPETIELVKIRTHQFAKRQMTWFRRQCQLTWLTLSPEDQANGVAEKLLATSSKRICA